MPRTAKGLSITFSIFISGVYHNGNVGKHLVTLSADRLLA